MKTGEKVKRGATPDAKHEFKVFSYVVQHDTGYAPNPYFGVCTLCRCKFRRSRTNSKNIVELADVGDWILGTGGADLKQSAGHGKLVYAMRVDEKLTREEYYNNPRFAKKKPTNTNAEKSRGDNEKPISNFEKRDQFVLLSKRFYYFGKDAIDIREFKLEANARGFHYVGQDDFLRLLDYLQKHYELGKQGEPCGRVADQAKEIARCKSSC